MLLSLPVTIQEHIAFFLATDPVLGPPSSLLPLLLTTKRLHATLSSNILYARIFRAKFDADPLIRRIPGKVHAKQLREELVRRCQGLKRLRANDYPASVGETLKADMWMAYLMFLENDGKNGRQLMEYARLEVFAREWVKPGGRMHEGSRVGANEGWTVGSEVNALGAWLFWFTDGGEEEEMVSRGRR